MNKIKFFYGLPLLLLSANAIAEDFEVEDAKVEKGKLVAEGHYNYGFDDNDSNDNAFGQLYGVEYGFTDKWKSALKIGLVHESASNLRADKIEWENTIAPFEAGKYWADFAFQLNYEQSLESNIASGAGLKLIAEKTFGNYEHTINVGFDQDIGENAEGAPDGSVAYGLLYKLQDDLSSGIEYYGDIGKLDRIKGYSHQEHRVGPVVKGEISGFEYDTGVLFGVSEATNDLTLKFNIHYEF